MKVKTKIRQLSLAEKAALLQGDTVWTTRAVGHAEIPAMFLSDGPHGLRKQAGPSDHLGLNESVPATCFPTAATVANSWNPQLGEKLGKALGREAAANEVHVVLGPGLNIKRSPLCGRNFEYFSEDPHLAGKMAAAYVRGIQHNGVAACPKHFAVNSQELRRMAADSVLDERTLREIYLTGFEIAVKEGKAKSIMSSYNMVNGTYANENAHLLTEILRDELLALAYGMWDAFKNSGKYPGSANWQLDFLGFLPGKRESRRMMGDYLMTQQDVASGGEFADTVAFGGWPLDDHDPRGFYNPGKGCLQVQSKSPYGIPYRTMYSRNIDNLYFAGRNISMTHAAMSSSRVMATCAVIGQAVGTAAAIARKYGTSPRGVYESHMEELQQTLMYDDCFLPYSRRTVSEEALEAELSCDDAISGDILNLRNGVDRNHELYGEGDQGFTMGVGASVEYHMDQPTEVSRVRVVFDSDLNRITLPGDTIERTKSMRASLRLDTPRSCMPKTLAKVYSLEVETENGWEGVLFETENLRRLVTAPICRVVTGIRLPVQETWGEENVHIMSFDFE